jgi:hypothetical protein
MSNWIVPALVTGGGVVSAGGVALVSRFLANAARRIIAEIVTDVFAGFKADINERFDGNDEKTKQAAEKAGSLELELTRQFGGNGNGIRQAVNKLTEDVAFLKGAASASQPATVVKQ